MMNIHISTQEIAFVLLEKLKANGTFDEFRRFCVSDIDAKSAYQNWRQRIESSALKFLSQVEYTPELNKNIIWEKMRKHLLDGHETQDISDGADRILNQILGPRTLDVFEPKIRKVVNEYLGNENGTVTTEVNGLNEITSSLKKVSENNIDASFRSKIDLFPKHINSESIEETSPEFEPLTSGFVNDNSDEESISGMSDLLSVGSPVQIVSREINDTSNSNEFETNADIVEDVQQTLFDINGAINHKNRNTSNESNNTNCISNNSEKLKTNEFKPKSKHHSSKASGHTSSRDKSNSHRSKNRNSNSHHSTSQEKNDIKKKSDSQSKDKKSNNHKHHSSSKDKDRKHKHKKSHHADHDKTPKRDRKDSRSDKKEKSSSLCKEPKSLNGNRSDDESNAGGSSRQKSSISKNKSSTSEKSKSSSSNHKTSRKDNSKDVVNKSKDKSSLSSNSHSLSQINNQNKKRRVTEEETNNSNKKTKLTNDQDSSMTDEQNAANVLLSMSLTTFHNDIKRKNIISVGSSSIDKTLNKDTALNEIKEFVNQILSSTIDNKKKTNNSIKDNVKLPLTLNSIDNASVINELKVNHLCSEMYVNIENDTLSFKNEQSETSTNGTTIYSKDNKKNDFIVKNKEIETSIVEINSNANQLTVKHDSNPISTVSNPKLLPTQIDANKKKRRSIKTESKAKKTKSLKSLVSLGEMVPVFDNTLLHKFNDKPSERDDENKINNSLLTVTSTMNQDNENSDASSSNYEVLICDFKGFSSADRLHCEHRQHLLSILETLSNKKSSENAMHDEFKGFDDNTALRCKNRTSVFLQFIKNVEQTFCFNGFKKEDVQRPLAYEHLKSQLEVLKINENQQKTIRNGGNGIQSQTTYSNVMAIIRESKKDNDNPTQNDNYGQSDSETEKECPVVNNNNHDITQSDWVVEQEMKYKLLPVKVKLERLMEFRCPKKRVSHSSKVTSTTQRKKIN